MLVVVISGCCCWYMSFLQYSRSCQLEDSTMLMNPLPKHFYVLKKKMKTNER